MNTREVVEVKSIVEAIRTHKFTYVTEKELQEGIAQVFGERNIPFGQEGKYIPSCFLTVGLMHHRRIVLAGPNDRLALSSSRASMRTVYPGP